jgi:hypothetical protein
MNGRQLHFVTYRYSTQMIIKVELFKDRFAKGRKRSPFVCSVTIEKVQAHIIGVSHVTPLSKNYSVQLKADYLSADPKGRAV